MNEVRNTALANQVVTVRPASLKGAEGTQGQVGGDGLSPIKESESGADAGIPKSKSPEALDAAVASINDFVQLVQRDLHFTVDEELDKTVIKVVDSHSGELIRQIPEDVFLELARKLKESGELHLVNALG
jgi:flagellar protein FlaG